MSGKFYLIIIIIIAALAALAWYLWPAKLKTADNSVKNVVEATVTVTPANPSSFVAPLGRADERVTRKPFGIYITPANSPIQPERFSGYHTGVDFEIFPDELNEKVAIKAICTGELERKETVGGYGGVAIEGCTLDGEAVTVIYGHVALASISQWAEDALKAGETFAVLGAGQSAETDGERKHLHLGIYRGSEINIKGYVASQSELSGWVDPCEYVCR